LIITDILTVPGTDNQAKSAAPLPATSQSVSVGLVLNGQQIFWGLCQDPDLVVGDAVQPFDVKLCLTSIGERVAPILRGRPVGDLTGLLVDLDALTEIAAVSRHLSPAEPDAGDQKRAARRRFLTGQFDAAPEPQVQPSNVETVLEERPLHPATRHGVSEALHVAAAGATGRSLATLLDSDIRRRAASPSPAILMQAKWNQSLRLYASAAAIGYRVTAEEATTAIGPDGAQLQRSVRRLGEQLAATLNAHELPAVHLALGGNLARMLGNEPGKLLGALYGLHRAASPCGLRVEDPVLLPSLAAQVESMRSLRDMIRFRKLPVQLVARAWVSNLDAVRALAAGGAADWLWLDARALGGPDRVVTAARLCREHGVQNIVAGASAERTAELALAVQADLVATPDEPSGDAGLQAISRALHRASAWLAYQSAD
jgi:methylaspartate ammonia-lyase